MASKSLFVLCSVVVMIKTIFGQQCGCNNNLGSGLSFSGFNNPSNIGLGQSCGNNIGLQGINLNSLLASNPQLLENLSYGGTLTVNSGSQITPNGISVQADNLVVDGAVGVNGNLPLLGAVSVDGTLPSGGQAGVQYNAGNGVALTSAGCGAGLAGINANGVGLNANLAGLGSNFNGYNLGNQNLAGLNNNVNLAGLSNLAGLGFSNNVNCGCGL